MAGSRQTRVVSIIVRGAHWICSASRLVPVIDGAEPQAPFHAMQAGGDDRGLRECDPPPRMRGGVEAGAGGLSKARLHCPNNNAEGPE